MDSPELILVEAVKNSPFAAALAWAAWLRWGKSKPEDVQGPSCQIHSSRMQNHEDRLDKVDERLDKIHQDISLQLRESVREINEKISSGDKDNAEKFKELFNVTNHLRESVAEIMGFFRAGGSVNIPSHISLKQG